MRDRVNLHKLKFDGDGNFDRSAQNSKTAIIAHLDMSSAVANTHYWSRQTVTTTFRGQTVRVTRFDMTWVGYGHTHCSDWSDATELNSLPWEVKLNTATNRYEFAGFSQHYRPLAVGVKPDDWDTAWQWKYYTKYDTNFYWADRNSVPVTYPRGINNNTNDTTPYTAWDSNTQYYVADDGWEVNQIWVTDRMLTFGGWQSFETYGTGNTSAYMCGLVNGYRSLGVRLYTDGSYQYNWGYKGGRVGFAQLSTDTDRITSYCDSMNPTAPSGGHVNTYRSNVPFVENAARTQLINNGKWSVPTFCRLVAFTLDGVNYIGFLMGYENSSFHNMPYTPTIYAIEDLDDQTLSPWGVEPPPEEPYRGPTTRPGGGNGTYTDIYDPTRPDGTGHNWMMSFGFLKTYNLSGATLGNIIQGAMTQQWQGTEESISVLNNGIIDCYALPIIPAVVGSAETVYVLNKSSGVSATPVTQSTSWSDIVTTDAFLESKLYHKSFLDCGPYQTVSIYLPFVGMQHLDVNQLIGKYVKVQYAQDNATGDLAAYVFVSTSQSGGDGDDHIVGIFTGNAKRVIPISTAMKNYAGLSGSISSLGTMLAGGYGLGKAGAAMGNAVLPGMGGLIGGLIGGGLGAVTSGGVIDYKRAQQESPYTTHSITSASGAQGHLGYLAPYILYTRSVAPLPEGYGDLYGYQTWYREKIRNLSGFTVVSNVNLTGISANDEEKSMILDALTGGFYA